MHIQVYIYLYVDTCMHAYSHVQVYMNTCLKAAIRKNHLDIRPGYGCHGVRQLVLFDLLCRGCKAAGEARK